MSGSRLGREQKVSQEAAFAAAFPELKDMSNAEVRLFFISTRTRIRQHQRETAALQLWAARQGALELDGVPERT